MVSVWPRRKTDSIGSARTLLGQYFDFQFAPETVFILGQNTHLYFLLIRSGSLLTHLEIAV